MYSISYIELSRFEVKGVLESLTLRKVSGRKLDIYDTFRRSFFGFLLIRKVIREKSTKPTKRKTEKKYRTTTNSSINFVYLL